MLLQIFIPYDQMSVSCFLENIDFRFKISQNSHFMFSWKYASHIQVFQELFRRSFGIVRSPSVSNFSACSISDILRTPRHHTYILLNGLVLFLNYVRYLGVSKDTSHWFGEPWTRPTNPITMKMKGALGVPIMNPKSCESKMKQHNSTELWGYSCNDIYNKSAPSQTPLDHCIITLPLNTLILMNALIY